MTRASDYAATAHWWVVTYLILTPALYAWRAFRYLTRGRD